MFVLVISVTCTATLGFQAPHWFAVAYMFPVLALYGLSAMLMSYCFSLLARSQLGAFAWAAGVQCVMFLLSVMAFVVSIIFCPSRHILTLPAHRSLLRYSQPTPGARWLDIRTKHHISYWQSRTSHTCWLERVYRRLPKRRFRLPSVFYLCIRRTDHVPLPPNLFPFLVA